MLKIRMQRIGKKGQAYFRLVVTEHTTRPKGKYLELLGSYDPHKNSLTTKADRVKHWMSQGAQLSPTANNLLIKYKQIEGGQMTVWKPKKSIKNQELSIKDEEKPPTTEQKKEEPRVEEVKTEEAQVTESEATPTIETPVEETPTA